MDGFKKRINHSLQLRLSLFLSLAMLSMALVAGVFSYTSGIEEARELQDDSLRQVARLFNQYQLKQNINSLIVSDSESESPILVSVLSTNKESDLQVETQLNNQFFIPHNLTDGIHTINIKEKAMRVFVKTMQYGERVAFLQEIEKRDEIAQNSALHIVMPFLFLVPLLLLMTARVIYSVFTPVTELALEIDQRKEEELHPIESSTLPLEIRPFVAAFNRLLQRVQHTLETQKRFVSDAAHELRTPLTALSLQAENLANTSMSLAAQERLATLRQGIERGRSLLDQLLVLARVQSNASPILQTISVLSIYRRVLEDVLPLAEKKQIDLGIVSDEDVNLLVSEVDLLCLIKNLLDNAIRYTQEKGCVDLVLRQTDHEVILIVEDNGPGISLSERERVFDAFYRIIGNEEHGSGLGLSIVQSLAQRMQAKVQLAYRDEEKENGLRVEVVFQKR